eukprot:874044-Pyramimonas_sp.AAC.1
MADLERASWGHCPLRPTMFNVDRPVQGSCETVSVQSIRLWAPSGRRERSELHVHDFVSQGR